MKTITQLALESQNVAVKSIFNGIHLKYQSKSEGDKFCYNCQTSQLHLKSKDYPEDIKHQKCLYSNTSYTMSFSKDITHDYEIVVVENPNNYEKIAESIDLGFVVDGRDVLLATLTAQGKLNKLASNISIGLYWDGPHYCTDYHEFSFIVERIASEIHEEQLLNYGDHLSMTFPLFDR